MRLGSGALVWAGFDGEAVPGLLLDAIARGAIGGLLLFAYRGNLRDRDQVRGMLAEAQAAAARGGLPAVPVAVDQEGGSVVRVGYRAVFPSAMAIAATGDPAYAERAARAVGQGLRADGIGVNHAPVCDVNCEPRNPVIGTRSFGDDPARVASFAAAWVEGSQGAGVASTPKHFPGHGAAPVDSHFAAVDVTADRATLEARELVPFRAALAAGAAGVMTAHVRYPALDPERIATFSRAILTDLLRGELGYDGLLITDSLAMAGATLSERPDRLVTAAVEAGVDAVMVSEGLDEQLASAERLASGVRAARLAEAIRRAATFREGYGGGTVAADQDDRPARALAELIAARAITAPRGPVPASRRWRVAYFSAGQLSPVEELRDPARALEQALRARVEVTVAQNAIPGGDAPLIVCTSSAAFDGAQAERARPALAAAAVHCALRSPYDLALSPAHLPALLTYGDVPVSLAALAAVLAGDAAATGSAPVRL